MQASEMAHPNLEAIVNAGEGYQVEFKRNVNSDISKELVAFANSSGGRLFVGIEDDGTIQGIAVTNELKARVQSIARDCDPPINVEMAERLVIILRQLVAHQSLGVERISIELAATARTVRNDIDLLVTKGWVERSGSTKGRNYKLTEAGHKWVSSRV